MPLQIFYSWSRIDYSGLGIFYMLCQPSIVYEVDHEDSSERFEGRSGSGNYLYCLKGRSDLDLAGNSLGHYRSFPGLVPDFFKSLWGFISLDVHLCFYLRVAWCVFVAESGPVENAAE